MNPPNSQQLPRRLSGCSSLLRIVSEAYLAEVPDGSAGLQVGFTDVGQIAEGSSESACAANNVRRIVDNGKARLRKRDRGCYSMIEIDVVAGALYAVGPRWSPDGGRIVFFGPSVGHPWKLYLLFANGGTPTQLIPDDANEGDPTWSPDGTKLAFGRLPWMPSAREKWMWVLNR